MGGRQGCGGCGGSSRSAAGAKTRLTVESYAAEVALDDGPVAEAAAKLGWNERERILAELGEALGAGRLTREPPPWAAVAGDLPRERLFLLDADESRAWLVVPEDGLPGRCTRLFVR